MSKSRAQWLDETLSHVRFRPDHPAIKRELTDHIQDRSDDFVSRGLSRGEADDRTLAAMGDPAEVGRLLDAAHKPLLGWLWKVSRWLVVLMLVVTVGILVFGGSGAFSEWTGPTRFEQGVEWNTQQYGLQYRAPATAQAEWERYTFRVEEIVRYQDREVLSFRMVVDGFLPWEDCLLMNEMYAVDSLGNRYDNSGSMYFGSFPDAYLSVAWSFDRTLFSWEYNGEIMELDPAAEWVELRHDLTGQVIVLRIDLPGGDGP